TGEEIADPTAETALRRGDRLRLFGLPRQIDALLSGSEVLSERARWSKRLKCRFGKPVTHTVIHDSVTVSVENVCRRLGQNVGRDGRDILHFTMSRVNLIGLLPSELEDLAVELGASRYRGRQLATWIYRKSIFDNEAMSDLPKDFRQQLAELAVVEMPELERETPSADGSRKLVFAVGGGGRITSGGRSDDERITLCVSTQVGCGFACGFCLTGVMGA